MNQTFELGDTLEFLLFDDPELKGIGEFRGFDDDDFVSVSLTKTLIPYPKGQTILVRESEIVNHIKK
jgi:hypothetical protein